MIFLSCARKVVTQVALYLMVAITVAVLCFPLYWVLNISLRPPATVFAYPPRFLLRNIDLYSYVRVFTDPRKPIVRWLVNSTIVTLVSTFFSVLVSLPAGYSLSRTRSEVGTLGGYLILAARMLPSTLLVIPLFLTFRNLGLLDNFLSLILSYATFNVPFCTWMMKGFFDNIPVDLEEAALVDGCGVFSAFWRITLPLAAPGIAASALYSVILCWNEFLFARTFINKGTMRTISVGIALYRAEHVLEWGPIMAAAVVSTLPVAVIFIFLERYLVQGLTAGAVK